ncbi:MAG: thioredoxin-disulfide reductase [bacterium]
MSNVRNLIIIGSGPAGLTAAIYAARADLKPLVIADLAFGGQLMNTTEIENFPGFPEGIMGPQLMRNILKQAEKFGAEIIYQNVTKVNFQKAIKSIFVGDKEYQTKSVIIATGADPQKLGLPSETKYSGRGVSYCATCDGAFFRNKEIAVVGGGDTALEEADFLTRFASKVYMIVRRNVFRGSKAMQKRIFDNKKITVLWNSQIQEFLGDENVLTGIKLQDSQKNKISDLALSGVFMAIGHKPNTFYLEGSLEADQMGYLEVFDNTKTNIAGVFVAGDVQDKRYRQAITAAGSGCMAALDAEKWLAEQGE